MNRLYFLVAILFIISCNDKDDIPPPHSPERTMQYIDLTDREVKAGRSQVLDVDKNGEIDFVFYVLPVGDPILRQDKYQFLFGSLEHTLVFVGEDNNSPVLSKGETISTPNKAPYEWWEVSEIFLGQKVIEENGSIYWEGPWKNVSHKYISIQVKRNNQRFNGWIEFSFDTANEKLILHKSGLSLISEKEVKAGI